jgi:hypothetical protein
VPSYRRDGRLAAAATLLDEARKGTAEPFPVTLFDIQATKNPA